MFKVGDKVRFPREPKHSYGFTAAVQDISCAAIQDSLTYDRPVAFVEFDGFTAVIINSRLLNKMQRVVRQITDGPLCRISSLSGAADVFSVVPGRTRADVLHMFSEIKRAPDKKPAMASEKFEVTVTAAKV